MNDPFPASAQLERAIAEWLPEQRWFAAKHRMVAEVRISRRVPLVQTHDYSAEHIVVAVRADDGSVTQYQIPLGYRVRLPEHFADAALPGSFTPIPYDALRDPVIARCYLSGMARSAEIGSIRFHPNGFPVRDVEAHSHVLGVEQSNTSVVYGEESSGRAGSAPALLIKFFRQLEPGINPDIELGAALTKGGCRNIAPLAGWVEENVEGESVALAMAAQFVPNAADGWSMALTSVRDLIAEADLHADEVGTDFAGEAERLGAAVASVHAALADTLGVGKLSVVDTVVPGMRSALEAAIEIVDELAQYRAAIMAVYDEAETVETAPAQRIHGDLHLGQTLRSPQRWLLIDFEGEPLRPLAQRRRPDSKLRDIAGMLRSFDYAGHQALGDPSLANAAQRRFRATEWVERNTAAFCAGYEAVSGDDPHDHAALLRAYQLDKAVYEVVYEASNRPDWIHLPFRAIDALTQG